MLHRRLLFLLALFLCTSVPAAFGYMVPVALGWPSKGPPGTYDEPAPSKFQDRVPTAPIIPRPVKVEPIQPPPKQKQATLSELVHAPWPCEQIRKAVDQFGREAVRAYARRQGYTKKQIDEAMQCAPEKRT